MVRVKICGITRVDDARAAVDAGADAIGLVFAESSRRVTPAQAEKICRAVGPWAATVGVFVNAKKEEILNIVRRVRLTTVQLHGDETRTFISRLARYEKGRFEADLRTLKRAPLREGCFVGGGPSFPLRVVKAIRVENKASIGDTNWPADAVLFDTAVRGKYGGTGKSFEWSWLSRYRGPAPFIVSGGLNPGNVARAIAAARPYGVDVSGGVEKSPGIKDARKIREFVRRAKRA